MRLCGLVIASVPILFLLSSAPPALAQHHAPSEQMLVSGKSAATWTADGVDVLQVEGPLTIDFDRASLSAARAVIWLSPDPGDPAGTKRVQVALIGDAKVRQGANVRSGPSMIVSAQVAGRIQLRADERTAEDLSAGPTYRAAEAMRNPPPPPVAQVAPPPPAAGVVPQPTPGEQEKFPPAPPRGPLATTSPTTRPRAFASTRPATTTTAPTTAGAAPDTFAAPFTPPEPVNFQAKSLETVQTPDGTVAIVLNGEVLLRQRRPNSDYIILRADRAVLYTPLKDLRQAQEKGGRQIVEGAYLEGDVRVVFTPAAAGNNEQRLEGDRVYYEFATDRAVLTDAIARQVDPKTNFPVTVRAKLIRQLAQGEFRADGAKFSSSQFASPSYSVQSSRIYVRKDEGGPDQADRTLFEARNTTFNIFDVPFFYLPYVAGSMSDLQTPVRGLGFKESDGFGTTVFGDFGLLEILGEKPPRDLDANLHLDYHTDRGPGAGINANYQGGFVTETSRDPWNFEGKFRSYFVYDHGFDNIGRPISLLNPEEESTLRGRLLWEHQHIFPDDWSFQGRAAYVSDQNFLEEWFPRTFDTELPHDVSLYLKRQRETEAFTLLLQFQPNDLVTTADLMQEQFEVEHVPEIGYRRIGDSLARDRMTFFSENTIAGLRFQRTRASLAEQGLGPGGAGIPSLGYTGITDDTIYRGDFRQELNYPIAAGPFKFVPYAIGRYTAYSDSPAEGTQHRLFGAIGAKASTSFWRVDDSVRSEFWDLNRLRHVIEPEVNVFTSAQTVDRNDVFIFEEPVDGIVDVSAAQIALRQRWQTYRGGAGRWRSVDFFTLNLEATLFNNQPSPEQLRPLGFRGLFYPSLPEASVPRNALSADAVWRVADNTAILADAQYNLDEDVWSTGSIGLVARRGERLAYYVGLRYINELNSNIGTVALDYEISKKYLLGISQSYDFGQGDNVVSSVQVVRRFDTFAISVYATRDERADEESFGVSIAPNGVGYGLNSGQFDSALNDERR